MPIPSPLEIFPESSRKYIKFITEWSIAFVFFWIVLLDPHQLVTLFTDGLFHDAPVVAPRKIEIPSFESRNLLNLPENEVLWLARKFSCENSNCTNDLETWAYNIFVTMETEWIDNVNTLDNLWIPLKIKDSTQLEKVWRGKENNPIAVMNGLYYVTLYKKFGYLSPIYWKKENELWFIVRSECSVKVSKPPPISYFTEIVPNATMTWYYQPIPQWHLTKYDDNYITDGKHSDKNVICKNVFTDNPDNYDNIDYTDVVFVVHGIGHHEGEENIVKNTNDIRDGLTNYVKKFHPNLKIPFVIPIAWRYNLTLNDEIILASPTIKWDKAKNIGLIVNDVIYYIKGYKQEIQNALIEDLNSKYKKFIEFHPNFKKNGKVSILAHSLGSVITFEVLSESYKKLNFKVQNVFLIGSPLSRFLASEGNAGSEKLKANQWIKDGRIFNIFHSFDPVAHRLEILFNLDYKYVPPHSLNFDRKFREDYWKTTMSSDFEKAQVSSFSYHFKEDRQLAETHDSFIKYQTVTYDYLQNFINNTQPFTRDYNKTVLFLNAHKLNKTMEPIIMEETRAMEKIPVEKRIPHRFDYDIHKSEYQRDIDEPIGTLTKFSSFAKDVAFYHSSYWTSTEVIAIMTNVIYNVSVTEKLVYEEPQQSSIYSFYLKIKEIGWKKTIFCVIAFFFWITFFIPNFSKWYFNERNSNFKKALTYFSENVQESDQFYQGHMFRYWMGYTFSNAIEKPFWCIIVLFPLLPLFLSSFSFPSEFQTIIDRIFWFTFFPAVFNLLFAEFKITKESICRFFYSIILTQFLIFVCFCQLKNYAYVYREYELECRNPISKGHCQEYEMHIDTGTFVGGGSDDNEGPYILPKNWFEYYFIKIFQYVGISLFSLMGITLILMFICLGLIFYCILCCYEVVTTRKPKPRGRGLKRD